MASAASVASAAERTEEKPTADNIKITKQGYLHKQCRSRGSKPWKERWFILQGSTLFYHPSNRLAGQPKLMTHLTVDATVELLASPADIENRFPLAITVPPSVTLLVAAASPAEQDEWQRALLSCRGGPIPRLSFAGQDGPRSSLSLRLRVNIAGTLAASGLGRRLVQRYLDPAAKQLIKALLSLALQEHGSETACEFEKTIYSTAAKIAIICHLGKFPPGVDMTRLQDETGAFCQDFLAYSRDKRLAGKRGPEAEVLPIDIPELLRASSEMVRMWRCILEPHMPEAKLMRFDGLASYYLSETFLMGLLCSEKQFELLCVVDRALRELTERY